MYSEKSNLTISITSCLF